MIEDIPEVEEYVPVGHDLQFPEDELLKSGLYVPAGHDKHDV